MMDLGKRGKLATALDHLHIALRLQDYPSLGDNPLGFAVLTSSSALASSLASVQTTKPSCSSTLGSYNYELNALHA